MLDSSSRCWAEVELGYIKHNVAEIRKMIPSTTKIMGVVKANAYGHGDIAVTKALKACGVDFFAVSSVDEALNLRNAGIAEPVLILGYTPSIHFHYLHEYNIIQTLISYEYAKELSAYAVQANVLIHAHIKVDTGMTRLGISCKKEKWDIETVKALYQMPHLQTEGIFSHFSVSDSLNNSDDLDYTKHQIAYFDQVLTELKESGIDPGITHLQNSYGIMNYPQLSYDYVRPGLLHLGVTADDSIVTNQKPCFRPIMTWKANISYVREVEKGCCVSYCRNYTAQKRMKIATVSCGYADGYPRIVSNQGMQVLIHGVRCEIIGNICMDQLMVDVSALSEVKNGDEVVLFGYDHEVLLPVDELSRCAQTINNEALCRLSARVPRIYK